MDRAKLGGHNVPPYEIERNFYGNLFQLNRHLDIIDELQIIDTSEVEPKILMVFKDGRTTSAVSHNEMPQWFEKGLPALFKKIIID